MLDDETLITTQVTNNAGLDLPMSMSFHLKVTEGEQSIIINMHQLDFLRILKKKSMGQVSVKASDINESFQHWGLPVSDSFEIISVATMEIDGVDYHTQAIWNVSNFLTDPTCKKAPGTKSLSNPWYDRSPSDYLENLSLTDNLFDVDLSDKGNNELDVVIDA